MKKFVYLCGMMLLNANMMAQIDLNGRNWNSVLIENFNDASHWVWNTDNFSNTHHYNWKAYLGHRIESDNLHHIYQYNNARYDSVNRTMKLVAEYDTAQRIPQLQFYLPTNGSSFDSIYLDNKFYFSGAIEYVKNLWHPEQGQFKYGYFEIRCKLPKHQGAFPSFWLHGSSKEASDPYYEEIDIFEYTWSNGDPDFHYHPVPNPDPTYAGDPWVITTGIYHNLNGNPTVFETDTYARNYPKLTKGHGCQDISGWHTYSCEWMPDHVYWFLDGKLVNSFCDATHIPRHPMTLKTNYAINDYYNYGDSIWIGTDEMVIDYIKVYQLATDCSTDETITCQNDLDSFDFKLKKSVAITASNGPITVDNTDKVTFRVTDSFEITGPFQVDLGGEFTVIRQDCPTQ